MRKVSGGSALAGLPVGLLGARGCDFRYDKGPPQENRAIGGKFKIIIASRDWSSSNTFWHSLLVVSGNRGVVAVDSLLRVGCAPPEGRIAHCQRAKSTKRTNGRECAERERRDSTKARRHGRANGQNAS